MLLSQIYPHVCSLTKAADSMFDFCGPKKAFHELKRPDLKSSTA